MACMGATGAIVLGFAMVGLILDPAKTLLLLSSFREKGKDFIPDQSARVSVFQTYN